MPKSTRSFIHKTKLFTMKRVLKKLWMWVIVILITATGYSQNLETTILSKIDMVAAKQSLNGLPDHNLSSRAWRNAATGKMHKYFGAAAAELLNVSGEMVDATPEMGEQSIAETTTGEVYSVTGFTSGLYFDGRISFSENPTMVSAYRWFRWDENWVLYIRVGCLNPVLVWEPMKKMDPKGAEECTWEIISLYKEKEIEKPCLPPPSVPCDNCCPGDSLKYTFNLLAVLDYERIGGQLGKSFGVGLQFTQWGLHRNDKEELWFEKPVSFYGGVTAYLAKKGFELKPTCDTCGYWGDIPGGTSFHSDVLLGAQRRLFKKVGVFGFVEARYDWVNTENKRAKFLSDEGIKTRGGLRVVVNTPRKMPVFRSVQFEVGPQGSTYATSSKNLAFSGGGFLRVLATAGSRDKDVRQEQDSIRRTVAYAQFQRDSLDRVKRDSVQSIQDSVAVIEFFERNLDTIHIAREVLQPDSLYIDPEPQKFLGVSVSPLPFTKTTKGVKVNKLREKVLQLQEEHNMLRLEMKDNPSKWSEFERNTEKLKKAERKLWKLEKKTGIERVWSDDWRRM